MRTRATTATLACAILALAACQTQDAGPSAQAEWAAARALWHIERDPSAWQAWRAIDPHTPEGREARRLLAEADAIYRRGIEQVRHDDAAARTTFERAVRIAPMSPALYLPLARAFKAQGERQPDNPHLFIRAAEYYRKFLLLAPDHPEAPAARRELSAIDPDGSRLFEAPPRAGAEPAPAGLVEAQDWPLGVALAALLLALVAVGLLVSRGRRPRWTLEELATRRPELHPRHHLPRREPAPRAAQAPHRRGGRRRGGARSRAREHGGARLPAGAPLRGRALDAAWEGHLVAFERALGPDLDLRRADKLFREAGAAIVTIARLEGRVRKGEARAATSWRARTGACASSIGTSRAWCGAWSARRWTARSSARWSSRSGASTRPAGCGSTRW
ncbi:MAG: hypothetical protein M5U28_44415 [Sandaracinaceae bacterium]|nr:hypothetical protein [Sandaracinaceae bacterium]